jgi:hypothetical protein
MKKGRKMQKNITISSCVNGTTMCDQMLLFKAGLTQVEEKQKSLQQREWYLKQQEEKLLRANRKNAPQLEDENMNRLERNVRSLLKENHVTDKVSKSSGRQYQNTIPQKKSPVKNKQSGKKDTRKKGDIDEDTIVSTSTISKAITDETEYSSPEETDEDGLPISKVVQETHKKKRKFVDVTKEKKANETLSKKKKAKSGTLAWCDLICYFTDLVSQHLDLVIFI